MSGNPMITAIGNAGEWRPDEQTLIRIYSQSQLRPGRLFVDYLARIELNM